MISRLKVAWERIRGFLLRAFTREEGGKRRVRFAVFGFTLGTLVMGVFAVSFFTGGEDTSFVGHSSKDLLKVEKQGKAAGAKKNGQDLPHGVQQQDGSVSATYEELQSRHSVGGDGGKFKYRATQIVPRQGGDPDRKLPIGTSFIGRLMTGIDTRESNALVRVMAPYGASFDYDRRLDKNSVLFGTASYSGSGSKVYVKFHRVLFPDGREFRIEAEALSSRDYTPGISGDENDGAGEKALATVGLTMLSGITDTLTEKESLSTFGEPTAKSSLKNGIYHGMTKATEAEAQRRAAKMRDAPDYVTIEAGRDLFVSLTETFKGEPL